MWHQEPLHVDERKQEGCAEFEAWSHTSKYLVKRWEKAPKCATMFLNKKIKEKSAQTNRLLGVVHE